jgi:hypothetical protein
MQAGRRWQTRCTVFNERVCTGRGTLNRPKRAIIRDMRGRPPKRRGRTAAELETVMVLTGSDVLKALIRILDEGVVSKPGRWGSED